MKKCSIEIIGMGTNNSGYPGAFTPAIEKLVRDIINRIGSPRDVLHLFSGNSLIGACRVDIQHPNATINEDVRDFISEHNEDWMWVILDPVYTIRHPETKLVAYGNRKAISSDVPFRRKLKQWLSDHAQNILWLDFCAPMIPGFRREKLFLVLPGGFHTVRVLSWLKKDIGYQPRGNGGRKILDQSQR